jgi:hypothetical protein
MSQSEEHSVWEFFVREFSGRGAATLLAFLLGGLTSWALGGWRRRRERQSILLGDARDTVVIEHHIVEVADAPDPEQPGRTRPVPSAMRIRTLGQSELSRVVSNGQLAAHFRNRAWRTTAQQTLISMEGSEGSFLLETLTGFVGDRVGNRVFEHDLYVMAPCCEPRELADYQPIVIVLIAARDLVLFDSWPACKGIQVEHSGDGARVLTLMELARRYREEQARIVQLRREGKRSLYVETMYLLDLALDRRTGPIPTRPVPWERFEEVLKGMRLD